MSQSIEFVQEHSVLSRILKEVNTDAEREWLRQNRTEEAKHRNLPTNWRTERLPYAI